MKNSLKTEVDILSIIQDDQWMIDILRTVRELRLPDWWIGAGFVRSKVWDYLHDYQERTAIPDLDVVYFNPKDEPIEAEKRHWQQLKTARADLIWSVTNAAHRHIKTNRSPYHSASEAIGQWVETPTCVGVRLNNDDTLELTAPVGIDDLINLKVRMNPNFPDGEAVYRERVTKKQWQTKWPLLRID